MLNEVKHLANVSCQVLARDPSDATLCQDDNIAEKLHFRQLLYYLLKNKVYQEFPPVHLYVFDKVLSLLLLCASVAAHELIYATSGVNQLRLTGVEGVRSV